MANRYWNILVLMCCLCFTSHFAANAQIRFISETFKGGVTADGYAPAPTEAGNGILTLDIPTNSSIKEAWLLGGRLGQAKSLWVHLNQDSFLFNPNNKVTPSFDSPEYGDNSGVHAVDVMKVMQPGLNEYTIKFQDQTANANRYQGFYLVVLYENEELDDVHVELLLNRVDFGPVMDFSVELDTSISPRVDAGLSLFTGYICEDVTDETHEVYLDDLLLGFLSGNDINSGECGGPVGSFGYNNGSLKGLQDDEPNDVFQGADALINLSAVLNIPFSKGQLKFRTTDPNNKNNCIWGALFAYKPFVCDVEVDLGGDTAQCAQLGLLELKPKVTTEVDYLWNTGATTASIFVQASGQYAVTVIDQYQCEVSDTVDVVIHQSPEFEQLPDTFLCAGRTLLLELIGDRDSLSFKWSNSATTADILIDQEDTYSVTVTNQFQCTWADTLFVAEEPDAIAEIVGDSILCKLDTIQLSSLSKEGTSFWSTGSSKDTITISEAGWVMLTQTRGNCIAYDSLMIELVDLPIFSLGPDTTLCKGEKLALAPDFNNDFSFLWSDSSVNTSLQIDSSGVYHLRLTDSNNCLYWDTIAVAVLSLPSAMIEGDSIVCAFDTVAFIGVGEGSFNWDPSSFIVAQQDSLVEMALHKDTDIVLSITDSNGCNGFDSLEVAVLNGPEVNITSDSINCIGDTIRLQASSFGEDFRWQPVERIITFHSNSEVGILAEDSATYIVSVLGDNGCRGYDTLMLFGDPLPVGLVSAGDTVCLGDTGQLFAEGGVAYMWQPGLYLSDSTVSSPIVVAEKAIQYTLTTLGSNTCVKRDTVAVLNFELPQVLVTDDTLVCKDMLLTLAAFNLTSYQWTSTEFDLLNDTGSMVSFTAEQNGMVILLGREKNGCKVTDTVGVGLFPNNVLLVDSAEVCRNDTLVIHSSGGLSYKWSGDGIVGIDNADSVVLLGTDNRLLNLEVEDTFGCQLKDSVEVLVRDLPSFSIDPLLAAVCIGDTLTVRFSSTDPVMWDTNLVILSIMENLITYEVPENGLLEGVAVNGFGCTQEERLAHSLHPSPIIRLAVSDTIICRGDSVILTAQGTDSYTWEPREAFSFINNEVGILEPLEDISVWVTGVNVFGCSARDTVSITVIPLPEHVAINDTFCCGGDSIELQVNEAYSYQWMPMVASSQVAGNPVNLFSDSMVVVEVLVSNMDMCSISDTFLLDNRAAPSGNLFFDDTVMCAGTRVQQRFILSDTSRDCLFEWRIGNNVVSVADSVDFVLSESVQISVSINKEGCVLNDTSAVEVVPEPQVGIQAPNFSCPNDRVLLSVKGGASYTWIGEDHLCSDCSATNVHFKESRFYEVIAFHNICPPDTISHYIEARPTPFLLITGDTVAQSNTKGTLTASGIGQLTWKSPGIDCLDCRVIQPLINEGENIFIAELVNDFGCSASDTIVVVGDERCKGPFVPNVFTPNGDGLNDNLEIFDHVAGDFASSGLKVYNRWGRLVYESYGPNVHWDGQSEAGMQEPIGVYQYVVEGTCNKEPIRTQGAVSLRR